MAEELPQGKKKSVDVPFWNLQEVLLYSAQPHPPAALPTGLTQDNSTLCLGCVCGWKKSSFCNKLTQDVAGGAMSSDEDEGRGQCASLLDRFIHPPSAFHLELPLPGRASWQAVEALRPKRTLLFTAELYSGGTASADTFSIGFQPRFTPSCLHFGATGMLITPAQGLLKNKH